MPHDENNRAAQEQLERRRLSRLIDALPVFSGFMSPDGYLMQSAPKMDGTFLWEVQPFSYDHDSITQIVDKCERASKGERVQLERPYLKERTENADIFGRGLLTLSPVTGDDGHVEEIAITLLDCDETGLAQCDRFTKSRLSEANMRIEAMLSLAQTVVEVSRDKDGVRMNRDRLTTRLDALAAVIDTISDPDVSALPMRRLFDMALEKVPDAFRKDRLKIISADGEVPISAVPLMVLLMSELIANARQHGAWRDGSRDRKGTVSVQSDVTDGAQGRMMILHWTEDGGPSVSAVLGRGFGLLLGERLFPQITGGRSNLHNSEDGLSWTFELPVPVSDDDLELGGVGL